jgi:hypothetical protein
LPSVWESSSILAFVTHLSFNFFLLSSSLGSNHHIIITNFHLVLVDALSYTVFVLLPEQNMYWNTSPNRSWWNYLSNELSFAWNGFRIRVCLFYSGDTICQRLSSDHAMLNVSVISPCTGLQNWWSLMRWKQGLKEFFNIKFSSIVHLWTHA